MSKNIKVFLLAIIIVCIIAYMAEFTWGDLPKNQIDPQLITEAIDAAIEAHNNDPEAHLGAGQSLEQHKSNEMIDHPASSIVPDKFDSANNFFLLPVNGDISGQGDNFSNIIPGFLASMSHDSPLSDFAQFNFQSFSDTDFHYSGGDIVCDFLFYGTGSSGSWEAAIDWTFARIELKSGNIRYGYYDGGWQYTSWTAFTPSFNHRYRIHFDAVNEVIKFYVDGLEAYSHALATAHTDDGFSPFITIGRGSSTFSNVVFGNVLFGFDGYEPE